MIVAATWTETTGNTYVQTFSETNEGGAGQHCFDLMQLFATGVVLSKVYKPVARSHTWTLVMPDNSKRYIGFWHQPDDITPDWLDPEQAEYEAGWLGMSVRA